MTALALVRLISTLSPIIALLALGLLIALRSGVESPSSGFGLRQLAANLSQTLLLMVACLVGLALLQQLVGFHLGLIR
ncbi:MAG TPA: hypothetical protein VF590_19050 [Isosphaeraceae bacterium]|jgi:hypothetical protein